MTAAFDDRLVRLQVTLDDTKETFVFDQNYYILANGKAYINGNFGDFAIRIDNIKKSTRDLIINRTSLWSENTTVANISLEVGRASYGTFLITAGQSIACTPTQPPDIGLVFRSLSQVGAMGLIGAYTAAPVTDLRSIAQQIATSNNLTLDWQASKNPTIGNYHFTGAAPVQVKKLQNLGYINAYIDYPAKSLVITDNGVPRAVPTIEVNATTGMIGVPQFTEIGAQTKQLIRNEVKIGSPVKLTSAINPGVNGTYTISQLGFDVSTWTDPFYWIMDLWIPLAKGSPQ
jgi:baseplate hub protein gp41